MSTFSLAEYEDQFKDSTSSIVELARLAEATERYENMCDIMKELVKRSNAEDRELSVEERNLLSVAYKNVIGTRRASWRTLNVEGEGKSGQSQKTLVETYKKHVETELTETCNEVIELVKSLIPTAKEAESKVFYLKMAGDYFRYLAESCGDKKTGEDAAEYYSQAYEEAKALSETHPIRLGLALNYSVCYYEILKKPEKACTLAKSAFDEAISKLDKLEEADYKDSTLIMQLLRDNLTLWTQDQPDNVEVEDISDEN